MLNINVCDCTGSCFVDGMQVVVPRQRASGSPCEAGYLYIPVCFLALLYLVYLAECWHSRAQQSLQGQGQAQTLAEVLCLAQQMRSAEPVVW